MSIKIEETSLFTFLALKSPVYAGKAQEIREAVEGWLAYIPHTFPHYTRHTISHSDEIVRQLSQLLFVDGDSARPVLEHLSAVEAYILIAAAYFHDAGMVVPDQEKVEILRSDEWKAWVSPGGGGSNRWLEIEAFRREGKPTDEAVRTFLADVQTRFLIAEFVRRTHHLRAAGVLSQYQSELGRFAFGDPSLLHTISTVCVAHGLRQHELLDKNLFPDRRDIRGEKVNVRLMAILLRLGDLLDMSADRACPLLLNAACPLPQDSFAHWTQYQRIQHRVTAPDRIELEALCANQNEHRVLRDWCQWLVEEAREAAVTMARSSRHAEWLPPVARLEGPEPTISIRPAPSAKYFPSEWKFELDRDAIFKRLIYDAYDDPRVFVRELIQNAADATRCKLTQDYRDSGHAVPDSPPKIPEDWRQRYPIRVSVQEVERANALSGEIEKKQVFVIEDEGLGMDKDVIERYLLQVGRTFYDTEEFRRNFSFVPTSRFGVGFLSTFAVSDDVIVETWKPSAGGSPIRLRLTGPRSYLLTEEGDRRRSGTRIELLLKNPFRRGELISLVQGWCRRLEVPVIVDDLGLECVVRAEEPQDFICEVPEIDKDQASFAIRHFPIESEGVVGTIYAFVHKTPKGEDWTDHRWAKYNYSIANPQATVPSLPRSAVFIHGIAVEIDPDDYYDDAVTFAFRIDLRSAEMRLDLSRKNFDEERFTDIPAVRASLEDIIRDHLTNNPKATGIQGWVYKNHLALYYNAPHFWCEYPEMIPVFTAATRSLASAKDLSAGPFELVGGLPISASGERRGARFLNSQLPALRFEDLPALNWQIWRYISDKWGPTAVTRTPSGFMSVRMDRSPDFFHYAKGPRAYYIDMPFETGLAFSVKISGGDTMDCINVSHPIGAWLRRAALSLQEPTSFLKEEQVARVFALLNHALVYKRSEADVLVNHLLAWKKIDLPLELIPPELNPSTIEIPLRAKPKRRSR